MQSGVVRCPAPLRLGPVKPPTCIRQVSRPPRPCSNPAQHLQSAWPSQLAVGRLCKRKLPPVRARDRGEEAFDDAFDDEEPLADIDADDVDEGEEEELLLDEGVQMLLNGGEPHSSAGAPDDADISGQQQQQPMGGGRRAAGGSATGQLSPAEEGEEVEEESGKQELPEPPIRSWYLPDLFAKAAELEAAQCLDEKFKDLAIFGLQDVAEQVNEGDLYICTVTPDRDGHDLIPIAIENGAVAVVAEREVESVPEGVPLIITDDSDELAARLAVAFYDVPALDMRTVGITGTSGKTTVAWLVREILEEAGQLTGMVGSIEHAVGQERLTPEGDIWRADEPDPTEQRECSAPFKLAPWKGKYSVEETTPDGMRLQKLLAGMRDRGATAAVLEVTPVAAAIGRAEYLELDVAVFTNSQDDPLAAELLEDENAALQATLGLFREAMTDPEKQRVVVNKDDPAAADVIQAAGPVPAVTYAVNDSSADVWAESLAFSIWETQMLVRTPLGRLEIITPLLGRHNVSNVLAAVATGVVLGVPLATIGAGIEAVDAVPGRSEVIDEGTPFSVIVDAANTPQRLAAILDGIREAGARRIFMVMSADGEEGASMRPKLGEVAHTRSDVLILTDGSPRTEDPAAIISDIVAGLPDAVVNQYAGYVYFPFQDQGHVPLWFEPYLQKAQRDTRRYIMEDRFSAIRAAIGTAQANDVVVITGKGHTDWIEHWDGVESNPGTIRGWFDDRVEARSALGKLQYLYAITGLERNELPWGNTLDQMNTVV